MIWKMINTGWFIGFLLAVLIAIGVSYTLDLSPMTTFFVGFSGGLTLPLLGGTLWDNRGR